MKTRILTVILFVFANACAQAPIRTLQPTEEILHTETDLLIRFHSVLYYPSEISLNFPGYIVGIEKSPTGSIHEDSDSEIITTSVPGTGESGEGFKRRLMDSKIMYVSHVVENFGLQEGKDNCALYNAYFRRGDPAPAPIEFCPNIPNQQVNLRHAFQNSWQALDTLKERINERLKSDPSYTHIMVVSMGWNTDQEEAIRNFNSIYKNIRNSSDGAFRPLFIGVTWPSLWENSWMDPFYKLVSYPTKAADADEVGYSWLGVLLHQTLKDLEPQKPIIVVGHSFGARATSMATCVGPAITPDGNFLPRNKISLLINLQGAYSINRFFEDRGAEMLYPNYCRNANKVALTSSQYDHAVAIGIWAPFAGEARTFHKFCREQPHPRFTCLQTDERGRLEADADDPNPVIYINADKLIFQNAYKTGGGAHSDIYRRETGALIWNLIRTYAGGS